MYFIVLEADSLRWCSPIGSALTRSSLASHIMADDVMVETSVRKITWQDWKPERGDGLVSLFYSDPFVRTNWGSPRMHDVQWQHPIGLPPGSTS